MPRMTRPSAFHTNIVLVFMHTRHQSQRMKLNGIYMAAIERGWQIQPVDETFSPSRLRDLIRTFHPLGCLIDASAFPKKGFRRFNLPQTPLVLLGQDSTRLWRQLDCTSQNTKAPTIAAARRFRELGLGSFTFIGDPDKVFWSVDRERHFASAVRSWTYCAYEGPNAEKQNGLKALCHHLASLERPFGAFLAADYLAGPFYAAADKAGLTIGKDLFVISVDNDELICKSLSPDLSSVSLDFTRAGRDAIVLLDQRLRDPIRPPQHLTYQTIGVIDRASSTRQMPDPRLDRALAFIRDRGCEKIGSEDVARGMKCSRRMAEKLVRKHLGRTILDCIRQTRFEKAKLLLATTGLAIDVISLMCGYKSLCHLKVYFRQQTGMTMRDWRKRHQTLRSIAAMSAAEMSKRGSVFQAPRVKSGKSIACERFTTERSESSHTLDHAARS